MCLQASRAAAEQVGSIALLSGTPWMARPTRGKVSYSFPTKFCDNCQRIVHPVRRRRVPTPRTPGVAGLAARHPHLSADSVPVVHCCCHASPLLPCFPAAGMCMWQLRLRQRRKPPAATATAAAAAKPPAWRPHHGHQCQRPPPHPSHAGTAPPRHVLHRPFRWLTSPMSSIVAPLYQHYVFLALLGTDSVLSTAPV